MSLLATGGMPADQRQAELEAAIATCNGDPRKATKSLRAANAYLEEQIEQILALAFTGGADVKCLPRKRT